MRNYIERAKDFVKELYPYLMDADSMCDEGDVALAIDCFNSDKSRKVLFRHGLSRFAFITSDYVVKYDFDDIEVDCIGGCQNEVEMYEHAKEEGFAYLFAEITPYFYEGRFFYIMPRIHGINRYEYDYAEEHMTREERAWCREHHLTDLHSNNYGFRKGKVCLVDYACRDLFTSY